MPAELELTWANWRNDGYWKNLDRSRKSREKKRVKDTIISYHMKDWSVSLVSEILKQGSQMLGTSVKHLVATLSTLGLSLETVADPPGDCDRRFIPKQDANTPYLPSRISLNHSVANGGLMIILVVVRMYSDILMGGRGPPAQR